MALDMLNLKYIWKGKGPRIAECILKKNKVFSSQVAKQYKAVIIKTTVLITGIGSGKESRLMEQNGDSRKSLD